MPVAIARGAIKEALGAEMFDTFRGHKFWVGAVVGGLVVWYVVPRVLAWNSSRSGG